MIEQEKFDILVEKVKERFPFQYWKLSSYDWLDYLKRTNQEHYIHHRPNDFYDLVVDGKLLHGLYGKPWGFVEVCMGKIFNDIYIKYKKVGEENICIKKTEKKVDFDDESGGEPYTIELNKLPTEIHHSLTRDCITLEIMIDGVKYRVKKTMYHYQETYGRPYGIRDLDEWISYIVKDKSRYSFCFYINHLYGISIYCYPFKNADTKIIQEMQDIVIEGYKKIYNYVVKEWCKIMLEVTEKSPIELLELIEIFDKLYEIEGNKETRALEVLMLNMRKYPNMPISEIEKFFYKIKAANGKYIQYLEE